MASEITKENGLYSVKIKTGTINIIIDGLSEADLLGLKSLIEQTLEEAKKKTEKRRIWNPRSKRHETVIDEK